jgi:hypothetical protein
MFHSSTELLIDYWRRRRHGKPLPLRTDIDPSGFAGLAHQVFIAVQGPDGDVRFRIAGEALIEWHGRQLRNASLLSFWRPEHRGRLARLLDSSLADADPLVVRADAGQVQIEALFAPLIGPGGTADRFLGLIQPIFGGRIVRVQELSILSANGAFEGDTRGRLRLAALDGRRIA